MKKIDGLLFILNEVKKTFIIILFTRWMFLWQLNTSTIEEGRQSIYEVFQ